VYIIHVYIEERSNVYKVLEGKPEGNKQLGRPRHKWEDNIRWILRKWDGGMD